MKKLFCLVISVLLLISMPMSITAAIPEATIQPLWENMSSANVTLGFAGATGTATASVIRIPNVTTEIEGTLTVYEVDGNDWIYVDSVSKSSTRTLGIELEFDATPGVEYVAVLEVTAHSEYSSESHTTTDYGTCP